MARKAPKFHPRKPHLLGSSSLYPQQALSGPLARARHQAHLPALRSQWPVGAQSERRARGILDQGIRARRTTSTRATARASSASSRRRISRRSWRGVTARATSTAPITLDKALIDYRADLRLARCERLQRRATAPPPDRTAALQAGRAAHLARTEGMARRPARRAQARLDQPAVQLDLRGARAGGAAR